MLAVPNSSHPLHQGFLVIRRGLVRLGEIYLVGGLLDGGGFLRGFNQAVYGPGAFGYALLGISLSAVAELYLLVTRPESVDCEDDEPELPY